MPRPIVLRLAALFALVAVSLELPRIKENGLSARDSLVVETQSTFCEFPEAGRPHFYLYAKSPSSDKPLKKYFFHAELLSYTDVDNDVTADLTEEVWQHGFDADKNELYMSLELDSLVDPGRKFHVEVFFEGVLENGTRPVGNRFVPVPADSLKFSIRITNYTVDGSTPYMEFRFLFRLSQPLLGNTVEGPTVDDIQTTIFPTGDYNVTFMLALFAELNDGMTEVDALTDGFLIENGAIAGIYVNIVSNLGSHWFYDPNLTIVLDGAQLDGDEESDDSVVIAVAVVVPVAFVTLLAAASAILVASVVYVKRRRNKTRKLLSAMMDAQQLSK